MQEFMDSIGRRNIKMNCCLAQDLKSKKLKEQDGGGVGRHGVYLYGYIRNMP